MTHLQDGSLDEFKDEVQLALAAEDFDQVDDVVVLQLLEKRRKRVSPRSMPIYRSVRIYIYPFINTSISTCISGCCISRVQAYDNLFVTRVHPKRKRGALVK